MFGKDDGRGFMGDGSLVVDLMEQSFCGRGRD